MSEYEAVIGLEVHVQLATKSKLFCKCPNCFGKEPNTNTCEVCTGMPGALPRINHEAVHFATLVGLATNCSINLDSVFARKNYFYPDLPCGYQISQFELPLCEHGHLMIETDNGPKKIGITRIHMENDAGKNIHSQTDNHSYVDLNRAGTPLVEIVSEPDMRSAEEAVAYLKSLYRIVTYLGVCDGNMEEGSFRCDANISIRRKGDTKLGTRTELKNVNSFRNVARAIACEIGRQEDILEDGGEVSQETRLYDADKNITAAMRSKEEAHDYCYFPDPDLLPVHIEPEEFAAWQKELPELPKERMQRFMEMTGIAEDEAEILVSSKAMADFFETAAASASPKKVANYIVGPLQRELNASGKSLEELGMTAAHLAELVSIVEEGLISAKIANDIFADLCASGASPKAYVTEHKLAQISDTGAIDAAVDKVIAANPAEVEAYKGGKKKLVSFFMGQVMRETKGKANPAVVSKLLQEKLG